MHRCNIFIIDDNVIDILGSINEAIVVTAPKHPVNIIIGVIRKLLHILHFDTIILLLSLFGNINHVIVKKIMLCVNIAIEAKNATFGTVLKKYIEINIIIQEFHMWFLNDAL